MSKAHPHHPRRGSGAHHADHAAAASHASAAAAAPRKDSVDDAADDVEDLQLSDEQGGGDEEASAADGAAAASAKKKNKRKKKKKKVVEESDVEEPTSELDESEAAAAAPATPPERDEDDMMLTASGKDLALHREIWGHWSMSDYAAIKVRGVDYLEDAVKIPPPCPPTMEIVHLEIYMCDTQVFHVCSKKGNWLQQYKAAQAKKAGAGSSSSSGGKKSKKPAAGAGASAASAASSSSASAASAAYPDGLGGAAALPDLSSGEGLRPFDDDFFFVVNFHVQTAPSYHLTMYFQRREVALANRSKGGGAAAAAAANGEEYHEPVAAAAARKAFDTLFARFIAGDTLYRNSRLKLIPFVVDGGNWFVTKAVGNRPVIIGNKITTTYHCDPKLNYMEVDIDVSGSSIGSGIFRVVKGYASYLTLDLTLLIEGQEDDELPEVILGGCRLRKVDLSLPELRPTPTE